MGCKREEKTGFCPSYESAGWFDTFTATSFVSYENRNGDTIRLYIDSIGADIETLASCNGLDKIGDYCPCESNGIVTCVVVDTVITQTDSAGNAIAYAKPGKIDLLGKKQYPNEVHSIGIRASLFVGFFEIEPNIQPNEDFPADENYKVILNTGETPDFIRDINVPFVEVTSDYPEQLTGISKVRLNRDKGIVQFNTRYQRIISTNNSTTEEETWYLVER